MTITTADLIARLRRAGVTEVDGFARRRAEYSTNASLYRVVPQVVAYPRHVDEMEPIVEISRATGDSLTALGAGTSIVGNAVGPGIVVDFSRHLHRIREWIQSRRPPWSSQEWCSTICSARRRHMVALRPRPVDPQSLRDRRDDRQRTAAPPRT